VHISGCGCFRILWLAVGPEQETSQTSAAPKSAERQQNMNCLNASFVFHQQDGEVTKQYYAEMNSRGVSGQIAVALFRAQKRSSRAKDYRRGKYRRAAYDVKQWSMSELCRLLALHGKALGIRWGWKQDPKTVFGEEPSWVLYRELPNGQVSFHSQDRGAGPEYSGDWDGKQLSKERIIAFCDSVAAENDVMQERLSL